MAYRFVFAFVMLSTFLLSGCGHGISTIAGFDAAAWRQDAFACQDQRRAQLAALDKGRDELYGARTAAVEQLLGRPDRLELSTQTEKVYFYYVQPGAQCAPNRPTGNGAQVMLRFDPLGRVSEVIIPTAAVQ
ncbi:hypothetical protein PK28_09790 [Hymenobacter sp. DG25B]|uniref:hypothetical protein n=1 Tax=Hymenobacter sp. DG25B TaxID=1385664 RepID=UPI0005408B05|nr:hypothetical protein [Hymenobacter sp. DG25B]AIZ63904.1 hypothetical protein PK28_09790 [Hymenobacter sp. DG25B]